ncbi:adenylyl-sulfate kinase [Desulfoplanes formicivorans]|uniref:Adenylylsulfate kinase n=1 Tax=Desulfoplanes formicivorans TaxID=1592317 RepID=A0A194AJ85_9BACT|nr:adenylyl-sulfate kinase [Desulfoplanes formicivorans]GAU09383.1 adenylylsulfate kinase [Desulfoplanes formicivorans]
MIVWLVGLSGSGKTTIGQELYQIWKKKSPNTVMLDGDDVRSIFQHDTKSANYTIEGRLINAKRMVEICAILDRQKINVICCILCIFDQLMLENRKKFHKYFQVYIDTDIEVLKKRDTKGLYGRALRGQEKNVVGLDINFSPPSKSDLVLSTAPGAPDPETLARQILNSAGIVI